MPMRDSIVEPGRVYRKFSYGPLLDIFMLDMRSYRGPNGEGNEESYGQQPIPSARSKRTTDACRACLVSWLRYQPDSKLTRWWHERFGNMGMRGRKVGIVALAANW